MSVSSAVSQAAWSMLGAQVRICPWSAVSFRMTGALPMRYPMRQPVIAHGFEKLWAIKSRSRRPGRAAGSGQGRMHSPR